MFRIGGYIGGIMTKTLKARYDAEHNVLRLVEPLEGVADDADVTVTLLDTPPPNDGVERPWLKWENSLSVEGGAEMARIIDEEFPPTEDLSRYQR
jgi:hypothetical protein